MKGTGLADFVALPVVQTPAVAHKPVAPAPAPTSRAWPAGVPIALLALGVIVQGYFWVEGFIALFEGDLPTAGKALTWALVIFLLFGWLWRWGVAAGYIGGRPTQRFGGAKD